MHWEWIVPVVVFAVWILLSLIRNAEEQPRDNRRQIPGPGRSPERPSSEVDKFLEEINRMRQKAAQQQEARGGPAPTASAEPITAPNFEEPKTRPASPPPVVPRPRREPEVQRPVRARRTETARPVAAKPVVARPEVLEAIPVQQPVAPARPKSTAPGARAARPSPAVVQLWTMLRTPGSMQTAILLREVLGPPRSKRPH